MTDHPIPAGLLRPHLQAMLAQRPEWYRAILADLAERLRITACENVLGPGDAMPDFVLPEADGELILSDDLIAQGPLVLGFFRGGWCPFCGATLDAFAVALPEIEALGARFVALTPDTGDYLAAIKNRRRLPFQVLGDVDCAVGLRFGTIYRVPDVYRAALQGFGIDLVKRQGSTDLLLPMPATFVIDTNGIIRYAKASGDITDRTEPTEILAILRDL
jgi:peroxiredoxin